jgi:hypothetical protein
MMKGIVESHSMPFPGEPHNDYKTFLTAVNRAPPATKRGDRYTRMYVMLWAHRSSDRVCPRLGLCYGHSFEGTVWTPRDEDGRAVKSDSRYCARFQSRAPSLVAPVWP